MKSIQMWSPDTCGCSFLILVDSDTGTHRQITQAEAQALHEEWYAAEPDKHVNPTTNPQPEPKICACDSHVGEHAIVLEENQRKNMVYAHAEAVIDGFTPEHYDWAFDEDRKLHVVLAIGTSVERAEVESKMVKDHGDKVALVGAHELSAVKSAQARMLDGG